MAQITCFPVKSQHCENNVCILHQLYFFIAMQPP